MSPEPLLRLEGLGARYGQARALSDVSLEVRPGEVVAIVGPNGAGKTTLLRTISGFVRDREGSAVLAGTELIGMKPHRVARAGFAHVPEGRGTISSLTVEENLLLGAGSLSAGESREQIEKIYEVFPALGRLRANSAGLLSGGEQQMLVVARGLMMRPRVLAIDEPSMGLAPVIITELVGMLRTAVATGVSILLVEQNTALASQLADRVYVLVRGEIKGETTGDDETQDLMAAFLA